ncbi:hypothetical protein EDM57_18675 [Brevibacillus gelatini]|uniref:Uncharacterized protein n=1 Tax=Brevibacillus gelatini TaxID=1655277 RepID=A0A3M8AT62_9BACL|nr:hypothetical protein [Brevibacillus gelatini]RNB53827.1 hypothetical protein EDM57_18675 [Brevibacillus gelatini]
MKATVNVMGIQTKNVMERIGNTLKAVLKAAAEHKKVKWIAKGERGEQPKVFTAEDPVFYEERLKTEIPEPNWTPGVLISPKGMLDQQKQSPAAAEHGRRKQSRMQQNIRKKATRIRPSHLSVVAAPQPESKQPHEVRDLRSSPSPPMAT